nr:hypothetical protein [Cryobacterium psychrotolerans]
MLLDVRTASVGVSVMPLVRFAARFSLIAPVKFLRQSVVFFSAPLPFGGGRGERPARRLVVDLPCASEGDAVYPCFAAKKALNFPRNSTSQLSILGLQGIVFGPLNRARLGSVGLGVFLFPDANPIAQRPLDNTDLGGNLIDRSA